MIKTFVKKPVKVQAVQWTGNNYEEIADFIGHVHSVYYLTDEYIIIDTPEGDRCLRKGDWIIQDVNGELYPFKPDIFEQTYEEVKQ